MEADEIAEFAKGMREAGEASMTKASAIISVLAVLVALVTVLSHREHTDAVLSQARASDRWSEYQGRRSRQEMASLFENFVQVQPSLNQDQRTALVRQYEASQKRIAEELEEDTREAKALEAEVEIAERRASRLDFGEALLQISVVLASVTLLTRRWRYILGALFLGAIGIAAAVSAFLVR